MTVVAMRSVHARYPGRRDDVLCGLDLDVEAGQIVGISGPSGVGKTSMLRVLSGLLAPHSGEVRLGARPCWLPRWGRRGLRFSAPRSYVVPVLQDPLASLDPRWSVGRSVAESLSSAISTTERRRVARRHLDTLGLEHVDLDARPGQLSIGQCQRVALARAFVARPRLLLADEPTSALDATSAAGVLGVLRDWADTGGAVVIVSHNRAALASICDRLLLVRDGRLARMDAE